MKAHSTIPKDPGAGSAKITWWRAKNLRSATKKDICFLSVIVLLAFASVWSGNMMVLHLSPPGVATVSDILDELQMPRRLPNALLKDEAGKATNLWAHAETTRAIVSFYAPWCGPCQKELPELFEHTKGKKNLLVIISSREDPEKTRRKLDNLGLNDTKFLVDITGKIMEHGKVKSLPTTFLVGRKGRVLARVVGYSPLRLHLLMKKGMIEDKR